MEIMKSSTNKAKMKNYRVILLWIAELKVYQSY